MKLWRAPVRIATGAYILDQGISKLEANEETASWLHSRAVTAFPQFQQMEPMTFLRLFRTGEIALGAGLLLPIVPSGLAGLGLTAFSGALMRLYVRSPELHREGSLRPNMQGIGPAKDVWMLAIGLALVIDWLSSRDSA